MCRVRVARGLVTVVASLLVLAGCAASATATPSSTASPTVPATPAPQSRLPGAAERAASPVVSPVAQANEVTDVLTGVLVANVGNLPTRSTAEGIAEKALAALERYAQVPANANRPAVPAKLISITALMASKAEAVEREAGAPDPASVDDRVIWIVRGQGAFIGLRVPPGREPILSDTGFLTFDDATGTQIGMGIQPLIYRPPMDPASVSRRERSADSDIVCPGTEPCGP